MMTERKGKPGLWDDVSWALSDLRQMAYKKSSLDKAKAEANGYKVGTTPCCSGASRNNTPDNHNTGQG